MLAQEGRTTEALGLATREEQAWRALVRVSSPHPADSDGLANCLTNAAELLRRSGRVAEAVRSCAEARSLREPLTTARPEVPQYRGGLAETLLRAGQIAA